MQIEDYMGRNFIFLFWGANLRICKKKNGYFLINKFWALSGYPYQEELLTMLQKKINCKINGSLVRDV
jgi:hypothetical protein